MHVLVRFITGLEILTCDSIKIILSDDEGENDFAFYNFRSCFNTLTVPRRVIHNNIDNKYTAFAEELRAILGGDLTTNVA